jgi:hypothetical protein
VTATGEPAVYRPAVGGWYVQGDATVVLGLATDSPVPADHDGDGRVDRAVYRPEFGAWYLNSLFVSFLGLPGDVPAVGDYNGDAMADRMVFRPSVGGWYLAGQPAVFSGRSTDSAVVPAAVYSRYLLTV